ncbi:MAG: hypothetical protein KatS3mg115_2488 [Candidatus Poribacteria bacterium]|nr:MAG: hypothetical protein KatS3mg115_2488 [Candidatus Poribacteria bacterium]
MKVAVAPYALNRIPLSWIIDDSTVLINLNYFWMRDRNPVDGQNRRWEDVPVVHPEWFTRRFAEFCAENGVRGKFSVVPVPAGVGRIDRPLPLFGRAQTESWLQMCREEIAPSFDITPEMLTHTLVLDPETLQPLDPPIWEQYEWSRLPTDQEDFVREYIAVSCRILQNVGLPPEGVTSPGGFGGQTLEFYAKVAGEAVREVTGNPTPYFFKRIERSPEVPVPVWYPDREKGQAVGEIIAGTGDWTGSWEGYRPADPDRYITPDLEGGRMVELIEAGLPAIAISHWQGFYGMHAEDQRGFKAFRTVVRRLRERDPRGERTRWLKPSEIARYACMREMAQWTVHGTAIHLDLPVLAPELTLHVQGVQARGVRVDHEELRPVSGQLDFSAGTFYTPDRSTTWIAFTPTHRSPVVELIL